MSSALIGIGIGALVVTLIFISTRRGGGQHRRKAEHDASGDTGMAALGYGQQPGSAGSPSNFAGGGGDFAGGGASGGWGDGSGVDGGGGDGGGGGGD